MREFITCLCLLHASHDSAAATAERSFDLTVLRVEGGACAVAAGSREPAGLVTAVETPSGQKSAVVAFGRVFAFDANPTAKIEARDVGNGNVAALEFSASGWITKAHFPLYSGCAIQVEEANGPPGLTVKDLQRSAAQWCAAAAQIAAAEREAAAGHYKEAAMAALDAATKWEGTPIAARAEAQRHTLVAINWMLEARDAKGARNRIDSLLAALRDFPGQANLLTLQAEHTLARVLAHEARFQEALAARERIAGTYADIGMANHENALRNRIGKAAVLTELDRLPESREILRQTADDAERALGRRHEVTLYARTELATVQYMAGNLLDARDRYIAALADLEATRGAADPETGRIRRFLAWLYSALGQWDEALDVAESAYRIDASARGDSAADTQIARDLLGTLYSRVGRFDDAIALSQRAFTEVSRLLPEDDATRLRLTGNLGSFYMDAGQPRRALPFIREAYNGYLRKFGAGHRSTATTHLQLGSAQLIAGDTAEACVTFDTISAEIGSHAESLHHLRLSLAKWTARCRQRQRRLGEAQVLYAGLIAEHSRFAFESAETLQMRSEMARVFIAQGNETAATRELEFLVARLEERREAGIQDEETRRSEFSSWVRGGEFAAGYDDLAQLYLRRNRIADLAQLIERAKARTLYEALTVRHGEFLRVVDEKDRARWIELQTRLKKERSAAGRGITPEEIARANQVRATLREVAQLKARLSQRYPAFARVAAPSLNEFKDATRALQADAVFLHFLVGRERVIGLVATRDGRLHARDLGPSAVLEGWSRALTALLGAATGDAPSVWMKGDGSLEFSVGRPDTDARRVTRWEDAALRLSQNLLEPLMRHMPGKHRWIVSPDGFLSTLPFEVLPWYGKPLIETRSVTYVQSLAVLSLQSAARGARTADSLLALGDPAYAPGDTWQSLAASAQEIERVASLFPPNRRTLLTRSNARRDSLLALQRDGSLAAKRYLLISAHAYAEPADPMRGAIVLAPDSANSPAAGRLTAAEIAALDINADLVVLSACDTGTGRIQAGEGVVGLPYAFSAAGARATVLTLWPVADRATSRFTYALLAKVRRGVRPVDALAQVKREFLHSDSPYSHPWFWAPYVLYGASR